MFVTADKDTIFNIETIIFTALFGVWETLVILTRQILWKKMGNILL